MIESSFYLHAKQMDPTSMTILLSLCIPLSLVVVIGLMETQCQQEVQKLLKKKDGGRLYQKAVVANIVNMAIISPVFCYLNMIHASGFGPLTPVQQLQKVIGVVIIEGLLLHLSHIVMHEVRGFYWM